MNLDPPLGLPCKTRDGLNTSERDLAILIFHKSFYIAVCVYLKSCPTSPESSTAGHWPAENLSVI